MSTSIVSGGNSITSNSLNSYASNIGNVGGNCNIMLITLNSSSKKRKIVNLENPIHIGRAVDNIAMTAAASSTSLNGIYNGTEVITSVPFSHQFIYYSSKVVSRNHALLKCENGKFYIKDTGSSSGTFLNGKRLSPQGQESAFFEICNGDIIKLGEDCQLNKVLHKCVLLKVITSNVGLESSSILDDIDYLDFTLAPEVRASVQNEFDSIWKSLTEGMVSPKDYLAYLKGSLLSSNETSGKGKISFSEPELSMPAKQPNSSTDFYPVSNNGSRSNINLIYSTGTSAPTSNVSTTKNKNPSYNSKKSIETALNELEDLLIDNQNFIKQHSKSNITNDSNQSIAKQVTTNNNNTSATKDNEQIQNCIKFIMSNNTWKSPDIQQSLIDYVTNGDRQVLSYYENLKQFPNVFVNITTKYVEDNK
ncbi:hypothetical protein H8356DRAFT_1719391 [Neocallimastix lanati (nom. inval.)]|jgi:hypothetical protein|nr:hypothetical protein H8356DRAFT_1719391 [Neocallimastix sp. JGI-2020a]